MTEPKQQKSDAILIKEFFELSASEAIKQIKTLGSEAKAQLAGGIASSVLPAEGPWAELEALGFVKGEATADDLFVQATLPPGWAKEGSDHAMWSYLLDERGIRRVAIFYKAAFYDRHAFARMERPGYSASTEALYDEGPVALPAKWSVFSEEERADFIAGLDAMEQNIAECPQVYEPHAARTAELRALVNEATT